MVSRQHLFYLIASLLVLSLLLVACERPIPGTDVDLTTPEVDEGEEAPAEEAPVVEVPAEEAPAEEAPAEEAPAEEAPAEEAPAEEAPAEEVPAEEAPAEEAPAEEAPAEEAPAEEGAEADTGGAEETMVVIPATHTVVAGENLYRIGLQYNIPWRDIAQLNRINPHRIYAGQVLRLPGGDTGGIEEPPATYVVQRGDNLYRIGLRYGISWVQIAEANGLLANPHRIFVGQTLKIPVNTPGPNPELTHVVRPGQTLFRISLLYGVRWERIAEANEIESPYTIYPGQTLVIPGEEA
ncbi:MAG TPA: LysM peptidoglycan-binding domain-containing protein [Anaerolineae bacterium]